MPEYCSRIPVRHVIPLQARLRVCLSVPMHVLRNGRGSRHLFKITAVLFLQENSKIFLTKCNCKRAAIHTDSSANSAATNATLQLTAFHPFYARFSLSHLQPETPNNAFNSSQCPAAATAALWSAIWNLSVCWPTVTIDLTATLQERYSGYISEIKLHGRWQQAAICASLSWYVRSVV